MATYNRPGVYVNELPLAAAPINSAAAANAAGAVIASFAQGPDVVTRVTSWYDFVHKFGGYNASYPATFQVASFFQNGGTELYVRRVTSLKDTSKAFVAVPDANVEDPGTLLTLEAKHSGADGNNISVLFKKSGVVNQDGFYDLAVYLESLKNGVSTTTLVETFNGIIYSDPTSGDYITSVLEYGSQYVRVKAGTSVAIDSADGPELGAQLPFSGAVDPGTPLTYVDYTGDNTGDDGNVPGSPSAADATIFEEFSVVNQPLVFFLPDVTDKINTFDGVDTYVPGGFQVAKNVISLLAGWAEGNRNFVVAETAAGQTVAEALGQSFELAGTSSPGASRLAVYYPHFFVKDPLGHSANAIRKIGPSGAAVGNYLFTDRARGPFKAPAGVTTKIQDAIALEKAFTPLELDQLNTGQIDGNSASKNVVNAIRNVPGAGIVIFGARTSKQDGSANRYINMRRSLIYLEKRLNDLATFAVFENNDEILWGRLITALGSFLNDYRNQGGLRGSTVEQAFYIKCDEENNTATTIAAGEVHIEIGVALEYPAEFVVINLSQKTAE